MTTPVVRPGRADAALGPGAGISGDGDQRPNMASHSASDFGLNT